MNIASGRSLQIQQVLDLMLSLSSATITVELDPERLRPSDIPVALGNSTRLMQCTGWKPSIPLEQTLQELLDYWREQVKHTG